MARTFYAQSVDRAPTMTVAQLIEHLQSFDPAASVIFRSPLYGCFGSNTAYSIDKVEAVELERRERTTPGGVRFDEETGEEQHYDPYTHVWEAWSGVVIA